MSKHTVKYKDVTVASGTKLWDAIEAKDDKTAEKLYHEMMKDFRKLSPKKAYTVDDREALLHELSVLRYRLGNNSIVRCERDRIRVIEDALIAIESLEVEVIRDFTPTHVSMTLLPNGEVGYGMGGYTKEQK